MITHIRMKNFKSWADSGKVDLAPLTGFFGTNSSGKSSLLQMLLLLKQTIGSGEFIFFGDENSLVNLGNSFSVFHNHDREKPLELEFGCESLNPSREGIDNFTFNTVIRCGHRLVNPLYIGSLSYYHSESRNFSTAKHERVRDLQNLKSCYGANSKSYKGTSLATFTHAFEDLFDHVFYLGPTRVYPQRSFLWEGTHPNNIGHLGEKAIDALLSSRVDRLTTPHESKDVPIEDRISGWLQEMDLAHSFSLKRTEQDYEVNIQRSPNSPHVMLADMGYGLSQFLPVLVFCYYAPEGSTLILEQPGMHLHPKVQSQIADLLIEVVTERKLQILVESHSEHLLNRLQRRVAEEKIRADQTALYFCQNDDGISTIEHLEMDELGNIQNWPPNFFGDEMGDLFAMTEAQRKRQKRKED